jgi:5,5'-dehydrodivanillate O-demethylase
MHIYYCVYPMPDGDVVQQDVIPYWNIPSPIDADGNPIWNELDGNGAQDTMAWVAQGPIMDRTQEKLGETDRGVIIWRDLLFRQMKIVEDGGDPMNVIRDPAENVCIEVPRYGTKIEFPGPNGGYMTRVNGALKYSPTVREMVERFHGKEALLEPVGARLGGGGVPGFYGSRSDARPGQTER